MNQAQAREILARNTRGVLATIKRDGRPQLSHVLYTLDDDGLLKISCTRDRAKTKNLRRDPRASLSVVADTWSDYVVAEGTCTIHEDDVLPELRRVYQRIAGKPHPDWDEFDRVMVAEQRLILAVSVDRLYPLDQ